MKFMSTSDYLLAVGRDSDVAVVDATRAHTYADLRAAAARLAAELAALKLEPGSRVAIISSNSIFWIASYLAVMKLGYVAVPLATALTPNDVARNIRWVDCRAVLVERRFLRTLSGSIPDEVSLVTDEVLASEEPLHWPELPPPDPDEDAVLMFTSGTTSLPKAVRVTHANIQGNTDSIIQYLGLLRDDRMLVILPFFYCYGASLLHTHLRQGARVVLCNTFTFPETAIDMLEREECTGFGGVPSSYQLLLRASSFESRELPSLRHLQQAGGKLSPALIEEVAAAQPQARLFVMYGQTEATSRLSHLPPELIHERSGSIGRGIPGVSLRVVGEGGKEVQPEEVGEIRARGANITKGYWRDPDGTEAKFTDGELRTGDLATVDTDGFIYVVDRKDDFIKSWGFRVSSQEVEACVMRLPDLVSAAAVGVADDEAGEAIVLFCTLRDKSALTSSEVVATCRQDLAKHMVPREVRIVPEIPLTSSGKTNKTELRAMMSAKG